MFTRRTWIAEPETFSYPTEVLSGDQIRALRRSTPDASFFDVPANGAISQSSACVSGSVAPGGNTTYATRVPSGETLARMPQPDRWGTLANVHCEAGSV